MKRALTALLALFSAAALFTCAQVTNATNSTSGGSDVVVAGNNPPTASFISTNLEVLNSGSSKINGEYIAYDTNTDGSQIYSNTNGYYIYKTLTSGHPYWHISFNLSAYGPCKINGIITSNTPPASTVWGRTCYAKNSETYVRFRDMIMGNPYVGQMLTAPSYVYHDDENDPEGSSVYAWYRCDTNTNDNGTVISGATGRVYTPTSADTDKYIYFTVTPKASSGTTAGTNAVKSAYFGPVNAVPTAFAVNGAGDSALDGIYVFHGVFNGQPYFKHQTESCYLYFAGCEGRWQLKAYLNNRYPDYRCNTTGNRTLDFTNFSWDNCGGPGPAPTVSATNL